MHKLYKKLLPKDSLKGLMAEKSQEEKYSK